jgi:hypothetical protein
MRRYSNDQHQLVALSNSEVKANAFAALAQQFKPAGDVRNADGPRKAPRNFSVIGGSHSA